MKVKNIQAEKKIHKENIRKILNQKDNLKKNKYENPGPKREYEKNEYEENSNQKEKRTNRCMKRMCK